MKLNPRTTAILSLDFQAGIIGMLASQEVLGPAALATEFARKNGFHLIHIGVGFNEGHPEIPQTTGLLAKIKQGNLFLKGSSSATFEESIAKPGDAIIYKHRVSAFSENELNMVLRAKGIVDLVLFGISTGGAVLSTVRRAFDLDYRLTILSNACDDTDPDVHRVLINNIYPKQATVITVEEFIEVQS